MSDEQWFIDAYDNYVSEETDGTVLEKSRDAVAHRYATAVELGEIEQWRVDLVSEGRQLFDRIVKTARERRRNSLRRDMEYILDALDGNTILGLDDPIFQQAVPLGDGRDKTLGKWSSDDWRTAMTERYRNAASAAQSAAEFDQAATRIAEAMASRGARETRHLFAEEMAR